MREKKNASLQKAGSGTVDAFLGKVAGLRRVDAAGGRGRLFFAMDATASRQPTWAQARDIQSEMFSAAADNLEVQLGFYRGRDEFKVSKWLREAVRLQRAMLAVDCLGGYTQIGRMLRYAAEQHRQERIHAMVFIGDAVEEPVDELCHLAGELGLLNLPLFIFHEGGNPQAVMAFEQMARLSGGACCPFDLSSPEQLRRLLGAVAAFASGGRKALTNYADDKGGSARLLLASLNRS
jgi:hypothetical protein